MITNTVQTFPCPILAHDTIPKPKFLLKQKFAILHLLIFLSLLTLSHSQKYPFPVSTMITLTLWVDHFNLFES